MKTIKDYLDISKLKYLILEQRGEATAFDAYDEGFKQGVLAVISFLGSKDSGLNYTAYDHFGNKWLVHQDIAADLKKELEIDEVSCMRGAH